MADVKWIKITTTMFDDEKIKLIECLPEANSILIIWMKLLTQAGKGNAGGYIYLCENTPYTDEMLATVFNRPINTIRLALETFKKFGMIEIDEKGIYLPNWEKHQNIEGLEKIKEQNRIRAKRHYDKQKGFEDTNVRLTLSNATDKNRKDKNKIFYSEFVELTANEHEKLLGLYRTQESLKSAIDKLNSYIGASGREYKSHYYVLNKGGWVHKEFLAENPAVANHIEFKPEVTVPGGF